MLSHLHHALPCLILAAAFIVCPVALRLWADDLPRNDEKPGQHEDSDPGEPLLAAA